MKKVFLVYGIFAALLFAAMNVFVAMQWEGYSSASQTVSELSAIGAPTRPLWIALAAVYTVLLIGFGWGVRESGRRDWRLRILGGLLIAHAIVGFTWPPMHQRAVLAAGGATLTDTLHLVWAAVTILFMMLEIGFGAAALGKRFRVYSVATAMTLLAFGTLTALDASRVQANLPTPWAGVWERVNIGGYLLWLIVLAIALLYAPDDVGATGRRELRAA
jgi:hypothetical protein